MKCVLWLLIFTFLFLTAGYSHPPDSINIAVSGTTVAITVNHEVLMPEHYIKLIIVRLNGEEIIKQIFTKQKKNQQYVIYVIPELKKGDTIEVEAACSKIGALKVQEKVE